MATPSASRAAPTLSVTDRSTGRGRGRRCRRVKGSSPQRKDGQRGRNPGSPAGEGCRGPGNVISPLGETCFGIPEGVFPPGEEALRAVAQDFPDGEGVFLRE